MASKSGIKVLVTGASGFLANHVVQQLLVGGYAVRGTVRSLKNPDKVKPLRELKFANERLELVEADLEKPDTWPKAVDSCKYVLHVASPFPANADANTIKTAVDGTLNVLKACSKCHSVEKIVLTSSIASIAYGHDDGQKNFSEKDWSNLDGKSINDYQKSKTIAERSAWDFVENIPEGDNHFRLTCLNPAFITGPSLNNDQGTSVEIIRGLLKREMPGLPQIGFSIVDVRDVAKAHIIAMENSKSDGERVILCYEESYWFSDVAKILEKEFGPQGYCIPTRELPYFVLWIGSFFDDRIKGILPMVGHQVNMDNSKAKNLLGIEFIHPKISLIDMAYSLIEKGIVPKKSGYKPRTHL